MSGTCHDNINPLQLQHDGSRQDRRAPDALQPGYAPVDQQQIEQALVFAQRYCQHVAFYDDNLQRQGNWQAFFSRDDAALLAIAATQDLNLFQRTLQASFAYLNNRQHLTEVAMLQQRLGTIFSAIASLVVQLEMVRSQLSEHQALKNTLNKLIAQQLAQPLRELIAYYRGYGASDAALVDARFEMVILGRDAVAFSALESAALPRDWQTADGDWPAYYAAIAAEPSIYGSSADPFERLNHIATHSLFTGAVDQFLTAYARVVGEAQDSLHRPLADGNQHSPHFALFLAFLQLLQWLRDDINSLTQRHLDFYYREILQLREKPPLPGKVHVLAELAKHREHHAIAAGSLFKAGKDALGKPVFYAADRELIVNPARIVALKNLYRHSNSGGNVNSETLVNDHGRYFAAPLANSADGQGAALDDSDPSWSPLCNKRYAQGRLQAIAMPKAEIGFAIASHYLYLAEGQRTIRLILPQPLPIGIEAMDFDCAVSGAKSWIPLIASISADRHNLQFSLSGDEPAITGYQRKPHGYQLDTELPVLLIKLSQLEQRPYSYDLLRGVQVANLQLQVEVDKLKSLSLSNDFGPIDASKPFQPFGALPVSNNQFIIGSQEAFQKQLTQLQLDIEWQNPPTPFAGRVEVAVDCLQAGDWHSVSSTNHAITDSQYDFSTAIAGRFRDDSDYSSPYRYTSSSRRGFLRLKLTEDFGHRAYELALLDFIRFPIQYGTTSMSSMAKTATGSSSSSAKSTDSANQLPPQVPIGPYISQISVAYKASQTITLDDAAGFTQRLARFYHIAPFGHAEQHAGLQASADGVYLLPQLLKPSDDQAQAAELLIGLSGLKPPQTLSLLFQVADGTADALSDKPANHLRWHYLQGNRWQAFNELDVEDDSQQWLKSGIVRLQIPATIDTGNSLLPGDVFWIKAEVHSECDAVCRLLGIATQAVVATFSDQQNDPAFASGILPADSISKLHHPQAAIKGLQQLYPGFGGRGNEDDQAYYTRISERLRHKDRAVTLWDYEHLVLEAFPEIFQVKCLNHTWYDGNHYRELAAGHVTLVTVPNLRLQAAQDSLRPYTSLSLLEQIAGFIRARCPGFVQLHVKNPQFEELTVHCRVCFYPGLDNSYHRQLLNQALMGFLSPWAFDGQTAPNFAGKIYRAQLLNFVEELPYVDYVSDFRISHSYLDAQGQPSLMSDGAEFVGSKAISILVSARQHDITIVEADSAAATTLCPCVAS